MEPADTLFTLTPALSTPSQHCFAHMIQMNALKQREFNVGFSIHCIEPDWFAQQVAVSP
jgi:hypothetical protein